jgi:ribonuclease HI
MKDVYTEVIIYTDGGSRGNPGKAAYGFVIYDKEKNTIYSEGKYIGITTNNVAEYSAVLKSLEWVRDQKYPLTHIDFFMDSQLVAYQLQGKWKIKNESMRGFVYSIKKLIDELDVLASFTPIPRAQNKEADAMVNKALDQLESNG